MLTSATGKRSRPKIVFVFWCAIAVRWPIEWREHLGLGHGKYAIILAHLMARFLLNRCIKLLPVALERCGDKRRICAQSWLPISGNWTSVGQVPCIKYQAFPFPLQGSQLAPTCEGCARKPREWLILSIVSSWWLFMQPVCEARTVQTNGLNSVAIVAEFLHWVPSARCAYDTLPAPT